MKCRQCGECCHDIPLNPKEYEMFKYILKLTNEWDENRAEYHPEKSLYKLKGVCPFLIRTEEKAFCQIYKFKPMYCNLYPLSFDKCESSHKDNNNGD